MPAFHMVEKLKNGALRHNRYTRNPMHFGMALAYAGGAVALDGVAARLLLMPLIWMIQRCAIAREEHFPTEKFGGDYRRYREQVRPWL